MNIFFERYLFSCLIIKEYMLFLVFLRVFLMGCYEFVVVKIY